MKFCDLNCPYAEFPEEDAVDGAGSCHTFSAIYCRQLKRLVHKNGPCRAPDGEQPTEREK